MFRAERRRRRSRWGARRAPVWLLPALLVACTPPSERDDAADSRAQNAIGIPAPAEAGEGGALARAGAVEPEAAASASAAASSSPAASPDRRTPTSEWADRRALAALDSVFPHSPHRALECQQCHRRPTTHVTHAGAQCTGCHGRPTTLETAAPVPGSECAGCHHRRAAADDCAACHPRDQLAPRPVLASVATAGGAAVRVRRLGFDHDRHGSLACTRCHAEETTRRFDDDCSLCHATHHRPEAECTACHDARTVGAHDNGVHAGCAGGGCHGTATVAALAGTRNVCLTCHLDQREHQPGQECSRCHVGLLAQPGAARSAHAGSAHAGSARPAAGAARSGPLGGPR